jgi:fibrillarin-like rRNA methylase
MNTYYDDRACIFRDRTNLLDYLEDQEIRERYRLPRAYILAVVDMVWEDIARGTSRNHSLSPVIKVY